MGATRLAWAVGGRIPRRLGDALARCFAPVVSLVPIPNLKRWAESVEQATGTAPTRRQRRLLVENWIRNTLWSLSLAHWSDREVLRTVAIDEADVEKLRTSLAGPGLVLALPHMGSWDFAGAWCARIGVKVVSVAERLPDDLFELFREARAGMGMDIYAVDEPDLMRRLANDVKAGRMVCLLSDRDLSSRGVRIDWPGTPLVLPVPAGPALLARRTGADLRVATTRFDGDRLRLNVSDVIDGASPAELMTGVVGHFADAVRASPENWLMLRRAFL